jgi:hypothetical protein
VVAHQNPYRVAIALDNLNAAGLLTGNDAQNNFNTVLSHQNPTEVSIALDDLNAAGLLTGNDARANRNAVVAHQNPYSVASALITLNAAGLLTGNDAQDNRDAVAAQQDPTVIARALNALNEAGLLRGDQAQANFHNLVVHTPILLHRSILTRFNVWDGMPAGRPTRAEFQAIIAIAVQYSDNHDYGIMALERYVFNDILGINNLNVQQQPAFNNSQSTHTASVHQSASESATRLLSKYASKLEGSLLNNHLQTLAKWVETHKPADFKQQAAARCIERLEVLNYDYTDSVSHVSTKQLMALAWLAIHDDTKRTGLLSDAKQQLIEGLYEIQRGYNLSQNNQDDNDLTDKPICAAGTFNKLCEKLIGIHEDVSLTYITKAGFTCKIPIVAIEEANKYCNSLQPETEQYIEIQQSIEGDMQILWQMIVPQVTNRLFEEFGSLYDENKNDEQFLSCVAAGIDALTPEKLSLPNTITSQTSFANNRNTLFQSHNEANNQQLPNNNSFTLYNLTS